MLAQRFHRMSNPIRYMHTPEGLDGLRNYMKFASRILGMPQLITSARTLGRNSGLMDHLQDMPHIGHALDSFMHEGHPADLMAVLDMLHQDRGVPHPTYPYLHTYAGDTHPRLIGDSPGPFNSLLQALHHLHQSGQRAETNPHHISRFMQTPHLNDPGMVDHLRHRYPNSLGGNLDPLGSLLQLPGMYDEGRVNSRPLNDVFDQATQQARQARTGGQQ